MSEKSKKPPLSSAMKRTSDWISSQELPYDFTVHIEETKFSLHKFLLVSKSGFIKKLASTSSNSSNIIKIQDFPGGAEAFELAMRFCYGLNLEMNTENIAMLRCAAEYLEMTEEYSFGNLLDTTEVYLNEVILKSLSNSVKVLRKTEDLLPLAEKAKLVNRCIDSISYITCQARQSKEDIVYSWAEDLTVLRIYMFQRVLVAMMARGFKRYELGPLLMLYAKKALRELETEKIEAEQEEEKRVILETIVSLLPRETNAMSVSFLSMLLRAAIYVDTTMSCRLDLEKRIGLQLRQAVVDDLLVSSYGDNKKFDVDTVQRILVNYVELEVVHPTSDIGEMLESCLVEIASDRSVKLEKFIGLVKCIPKQSRINEDGMYRAIDIYLKAHPNLSEVEKKKVCNLMDSQKLSREVRAHASRNNCLPIETVVRILFYDQENLHRVSTTSEEIVPLHELGSYYNERAKLNRENKDMKLKLLEMKMKFEELEKEKYIEVMSGYDCSPISMASMVKHPLPRESFIRYVSRILGNFNPFTQTQGRIKLLPLFHYK